MLIKKDYDEIKSTKYYDDFLDNLGPVKRKFFLDVIKAKDYEEFKTLNQTNSQPAKQLISIDVKLTVINIKNASKGIKSRNIKRQVTSRMMNNNLEGFI